MHAFGVDLARKNSNEQVNKRSKRLKMSKFGLHPKIPVIMSFASSMGYGIGAKFATRRNLAFSHDAMFEALLTMSRQTGDLHQITWV